MVLLESLISVALGNSMGNAKAMREFDLEDFLGPVFKIDHVFFSL